MFVDAFVSYSNADLAKARVLTRYLSNACKPQRAMRTPAPGGLLTLKQAAAALGIGERTLREHMRAGSLSYVDVGRGKQRRAPRFAPEDIEAFKTKHRGTTWRSANVAKSTTTSSNFETVDFALYWQNDGARSPRRRTRQA
jgi:excisionase family DNA binding protein